MEKQAWEIIDSNPMRVKEEHYISKNPYLGKKTTPLLKNNTTVRPINPNDLHQKFEENLSQISIPTGEGCYLFTDGNVSGEIQFKPLEYCHNTDKPNTFKYWDKIILKWQPRDEKPSELLKILDEFGFAKE